MANNLQKYPRIYQRFAVNSILEELEYRVAFLFTNLTGMLWTLGTFFFIYVIFTQASSVGGWDKHSMILLYLTFSITTDLFHIFLRTSLERFARLIRDGALDGFLLKPVNSRFMVSLISGRLGFNVVFRLVVAVALLLHYASISSPSIVAWASYVFFIVLGLISVYSLIFLIHTLNIWFVRLDNLTHFSFTTMEIAKVPLDSWPKLVQDLLVYLVPIGIVS